MKVIRDQSPPHMKNGTVPLGEFIECLLRWASKPSPAVRNADPYGWPWKPASCQVISQTEGEHNGEPEKAGADEDQDKPVFVLYMHEEQRDQNSLRESDRQRGHHMDGAQWQVSESNRSAKQDQQGRPDAEVGFGGDDVFAHPPVLFTR